MEKDKFGNKRNNLTGKLEFSKLCKLCWKQVTGHKLGKVHKLEAYSYLEKAVIMFKFERKGLQYDLLYDLNNDEFLINAGYIREGSEKV